MPLMRQTNPGWVATCMTENPAVARASSPLDGSPGAQRTITEEPVSTTTVTPLVPEQAAACAGTA